MPATPRSALAVPALLAMCVAVTWADTGPFELANGHIRLAGEGAAVTELRFGAAGQGRFGQSWLRRMRFPELAALPECEWRRTDSEIIVTGLEVRPNEQLKIETAHVPDKLEPGHSLGQSFTVAAGSFSKVSVRTPTWNMDDSSATLQLRRGGPDGDIIVSRRLKNIPDNSTQSLALIAQPPGRYYVELLDAQGDVGWWSCAKDEYESGTAFADGKEMPGRDRSLTVHIARPAGKARLRLSLDGPELKIAAEKLPGAETRNLPLLMDFRWDNTGYDVSAGAVPFARFFTDGQRYLPAEQFKRASSPGHVFACRWMEADGTEDHDLRFSGNNLHLSWSLTDNTNTFHLKTQEGPGPDDTRANVVALTCRPRDDALPAEWPSFETPDPELTRDLNRLFYERAFSYPAPAGPAPWFEWSPLIRSWFAGPLRNGTASGIGGAKIDDDGYVYTWGGEPGWPFPDPKKYDTRHFDTNARFILGCWRHICWTQDEQFLRNQAERLRRAMAYQLTTLRGEEGLIVAASKDVNGRHKGVGNNYWDILPFGHLDAYANSLYYASLEAMAQLETLLAALPDIETQAAARPPDYYRDLAAKVKTAYNDSFWDDEKGRYIGCVDIDGRRHDYGFTFVNLETMAYGLASEEQARRIYDWMEHGKSSTGKADIYSRWVFAPRATTIHNPMWNEDGVTDPHADGVEPWWHFGWRGTPFGDQCQDGGAIFYTSFYDLMARSKLLGPERAWSRWEEILARYRDPDRLCGGPPLFRGEHPQQAHPGAVGLDIPFPESGLVPCWFLYGLAGVQATSEGLVIAPRLPKALPWLAVHNMCYRNLSLDLRVTNTSVELTSHRQGYEFTWRRDLPPGGQAIFRQPPAPVDDFPNEPEPTSAWRAKWIWAPGDPEEVRVIQLRKAFSLADPPERAPIAATADNSFRLFVNGAPALEGGAWGELFRTDIASLLRSGRNVLAIEAKNEAGPAGVLLETTLAAGQRESAIVSDRTWRVSASGSEGWQRPDFDDSAWAFAAELGRPPVAPWGEIGDPGLRPQPGGASNARPDDFDARGILDE